MASRRLIDQPAVRRDRRRMMPHHSYLTLRRWPHGPGHVSACQVGSLRTAWSTYHSLTSNTLRPGSQQKEAEGQWGMPLAQFSRQPFIVSGRASGPPLWRTRGRREWPSHQPRQPSSQRPGGLVNSQAGCRVPLFFRPADVSVKHGHPTPGTHSYTRSMPLRRLHLRDTPAHTPQRHARISPTESAPPPPHGRARAL